MLFSRKLLIVRHCESTGQAPDASLTAAGFSQADSLARFLSDQGIDLIVSSAYRRAQQSIEPLAELLGLPVGVDPRLNERVLSDVPIDNWREVVRDSFRDRDLRVPGGESAREVVCRAWAALDDVLKGGHVLPLVVTHGNLMALVLNSLESGFGYRDWEALSNPDVYLLEEDEHGQFRFKRICTYH